MAWVSTGGDWVGGHRRQGSSMCGGWGGHRTIGRAASSGVQLSQAALWVTGRARAQGTPLPITFLHLLPVNAPLLDQWGACRFCACALQWLNQGWALKRRGKKAYPKGSRKCRYTEKPKNESCLAKKGKCLPAQECSRDQDTKSRL